MPDEFFDWLNECPVQWVREGDNAEGSTYWFRKPDEEEE